MSIWTIDGRIKHVPFHGAPRLAEYLTDWNLSDARMFISSGEVFLSVSFSKEIEPVNKLNNAVIGVDRGINYLAVTTDGQKAQFFGGAKVTHIRNRYLKTRASIQRQKATTAAVLVRWVSTTSGSWHDPANWSTGATPGPFADVLIETGSAITVTHSQNSDSIHSLHSQAALKITGGSLIIATESEVSHNFTLSGGTLAGSGNLTVNGLLIWTGGTMSGSGHTIINCAAAISSLSAKTLSRRILDNNGTTTWSGGPINADSGGVFNNLPGASFVLQGDLAFSGSASETFNNVGTFRRVHPKFVAVSEVCFWSIPHLGYAVPEY